MTPREQNILTTLNILVLVFRSQRHVVPKLTDEERHTLRITQEHLTLAGLTTPVFLNTLTELNTKGYLFSIGVFEKKYHPEIQKFLDEETFSKILGELDKVDTTELVDKFKIAGNALLQENLPANVSIPSKEILEEKMDIKDILNTARDAMKDYTPEVISMIVLSPFRSVERLLEKMNQGLAFDDVKDAGVWYDPIACELHIEDTSISTIYQNKPAKAHFALQALFKSFGEPRIDYIDIPEFDREKDMEVEKRSYRDSLNRLLKKHPRLKELFTVHTDHLFIQGEFLEHPH